LHLNIEIILHILILISIIALAVGVWIMLQAKQQPWPVTVRALLFLIPASVVSFFIGGWLSYLVRWLSDDIRM
jgi:nitrogen fixation-related uncharacterized protein